jgi:hypothetical protein
MKAPSYFEFNEARTQRSTAFDVIEIDDYLLTEETEIADDVQMKLRQISRKHIRRTTSCWCRDAKYELHPQAHMRQVQAAQAVGRLKRWAEILVRWMQAESSTWNSKQ